MAAPTALGDGWPVFTGATVEPSAHIGSGGRAQTALEKRRGGTAGTEPDAEDGPDSAAMTRREEYRRGLALHMAEVRRFVALRVSSYADAEDIAQEVLLQAWLKLGTFQSGNFLAWLYAIAPFGGGSLPRPAAIRVPPSGVHGTRGVGAGPADGG